MTKMKINIDKHATGCTVCFDMARRGYRSEPRYFDDFFAGKLRLIKYALYYQGKLAKKPKEPGE